MPNDIVTKFVVSGKHYDIASVADFNKFVKELNNKKDSFLVKANRGGVTVIVVIK